MEKDLNISVLFDLYGELLTKRQQEIISLYFNLDNSLGEIAEELQISRQSVKDAIDGAKNKLNFYEEKLKLSVKFQRVEKLIDKARGQIEDGKTREMLDKIFDILEE